MFENEWARVIVQKSRDQRAHVPTWDWDPTSCRFFHVGVNLLKWILKIQIM